MGSHTNLHWPTTVLCSRRILRTLLIGSCIAAASIGSQAQDEIESNPCGNPFRNHFGPYDYRTVGMGARSLVENAHFTRGVETMTKPATSMMSNMAGDVAYTLEVFPNHPRALVTMTRLSERDKSNPANAGKYTVECWFDRAIRFRPDDPIPKMLFAEYLIKGGKKELARYQLERAQANAKDNPFTHNNVGLVYFDLGDYDSALIEAHKSLELGWPRTDLKKKLQSVNRWKEPELITPATESQPEKKIPQSQ